MFEPLPELAAKDFVVDMKLCRVLLEDNRFYPWLILVPRRDRVQNMTFLTMADRLQLMRETALCEEVISELYKPAQTNVAVINNRIQQLYVQVIARFEDDPEWPATVWGGRREVYEKEKKKETIGNIKRTIMIKMADGRFCQH